MSMPAVGSPAPAFVLPSTNGTTVTLEQFLGQKNVLLAFFPLAFTGTCTAQVCEFSEDYGRYEGAETVVLPVSVDSVPTLKVFKDRERLRVDLHSDFKREVSRLYGTLLEAHFFSNRAYVLIDRQGIVRWAFAEESPGHRRENAEILAEIAKLA